MKVVIVGGGIIGLSVAWGLARRGLTPIVYEQGPIPNPLGSSSDASRLIRYTYGPMGGYARMVREAYEAFELLWLDLGCRHHFETGTLVVARGDDAWARASATTLAELHLPFEELEPGDLARRFPFCRADGARWALLTPTGSVLLADLILHDLAVHLRNQGLTLIEGALVDAIDPARASIRLADGREEQGDALVVAAGPWTPRLLAGMAGRVRPSRQVAVHLEPPDEHLALWQRAPILLDDIHVPAGGFYAVPPIAGHGIKVGDHGFSLVGEPDLDREPRDAEIEAILALGRERVVGFERYRVARARTCFYSVSPDERFIAETEGKALVLAGFSGHGFKFGPVLGLAAAGFLDGDMAPERLRAFAAGEPEGA